MTEEEEEVVHYEVTPHKTELDEEEEEKVIESSFRIFWG